MSAFQHLHARIGRLTQAQLFFIGGAMKSGTTWLRLLLDAHPQIACKGEGHVANHFAPLLAQLVVRHNRKIDQKNQDVFNEIDGFPRYAADDLAYLIGAALLLPFAGIGVPEDLRAVGEKTPDNVRHFDLLHRIFPAARFIHVVRDGRDCAVSAWFHNLRANPAWMQRTHSSLAEYSAGFARSWAADMAQAETFAAACPTLCHVVHYEDLLEDPGAALGDICAFLAVAADTATVARCCDAARFEQFSGGRPRGEEDRTSFFRQGIRGDWRNHLDDAANRAFIRAASPWLERLGYL